MKVPFTLTDFSGGMKGKKGQLNSADTKYVQDLNNMLVERNNTLKSRNGVETLPITLLTNDKVLPFEANGKKYYFVYDPLLNLKYVPSVAGATRFAYSAGGQRHVDMFATKSSSLSAWNYITKEVVDHSYLLQNNDGLVYDASLVPAAPQDDVTKWAAFKNYPTGYTELEFHQYLRKLNMESSPTFVFTEEFPPANSARFLYQASVAHAVIENTFWWNRMFVLDEDFNVITTEIDLANFVSYDSGHVPLTSIPTMDTDVRDSSYDNLQTIRESRYGGSTLEYKVEVMNQGVMFYNPEGKLPNMFMQLNDQGQTDGVLRDFRTLYLDEVKNGIFKTAPYFTAAQYAGQQLFDQGRMRIEMNYITSRWNAADDLMDLVDYVLTSNDLATYYLDNVTDDTANNVHTKFSYNVKDTEDLTDVVKAFLPLTSDAGPCVAMDNIRLEDSDGQVHFASPSLASLDRDFEFPHDSSTVWQDTDLAVELPFIFGANLVIYSPATDVAPLSGIREKFVSPILTLTQHYGVFTTFALVPITRFSGGSIGKFLDATVAYLPRRLTALLAVEDASYLPVVVYSQVLGMYTFDFAGIKTTIAASVFPARLGYESNDVFYVLDDFKTLTYTYSGSANSSTSGWFGDSTSNTAEYSFRIRAHNGGVGYSIIDTKTAQVSKAFGFNSDGYFSSVSEYAGRLFLASVSKPNLIAYSSTTDYLEFSTVRGLVNSELDPVVTRGARYDVGFEAIAALHESNSVLKVITDRRIFSISIDDVGLVVASDPSDIATSGKTPVTINNFTYFVSGDNKDILLAVFSEKTQRFEYYSVFSEVNVDDETDIISLITVSAAYKLVVLTGQGLYVGTIMQANQVAWSRLTFTFTPTTIATTLDALYLSAGTAAYKLQFLVSSDLEAGVLATMKMLAPTVMANLINVQKTNINYIGMRLHDVTAVGTFSSALQSGSDARELSASDLGDVVDIANKNYNDIYDSIELSFEGGQNRIIYIRGSLGV